MPLFNFIVNESAIWHRSSGSHFFLFSRCHYGSTQESLSFAFPRPVTHRSQAVKAPPSILWELPTVGPLGFFSFLRYPGEERALTTCSVDLKEPTVGGKREGKPAKGTPVSLATYLVYPLAAFLEVAHSKPFSLSRLWLINQTSHRRQEDQGRERRGAINGCF